MKDLIRHILREHTKLMLEEPRKWTKEVVMSVAKKYDNLRSNKNTISQR
jgi:hypothetical protein